jgi:hypothetical protein
VKQPTANEVMSVSQVIVMEVPASAKVLAILGSSPPIGDVARQAANRMKQLSTPIAKNRRGDSWKMEEEYDELN